MRIVLSILILGISVVNAGAQSFRTKSMSLLFDVDKSELTAQHREQIRTNILEIGFGSIKEIYIAGHTDSDHTDLYNMGLSERRAKSTVDYLKNQGIPDNLIRSEAFGESEPVSDDKSLNRRSVVTFVYTVWRPYDQEDNRFVVIRVKEAKYKRGIRAKVNIEAGEEIRELDTDRYGHSTLPIPAKSKALAIVSAKGYLNHKVDLNVNPTEYRNDTSYYDVLLYRAKVVRKMSFTNIYFYTDTDSLKPESQPDLIRLLATLQDFTDVYIEIQGHMNYPISRPATPYQKHYCYSLSYRRARKIYQYLVSKGIEPERLTYRGMSNYRMLFPDPQSTEQADANKRVEIWTLKKIPI